MTPRGITSPARRPRRRSAPVGAVGSEEAPIEGLASVRRSNGTCSFPAFRFHEWLREIRREGISETRLTSLNSPKSRLVGYSDDRHMFAGIGLFFVNDLAPIDAVLQHQVERTVANGLPPIRRSMASTLLIM